LLHTNSQQLVQTLEALPLLDGRYSDIKWVNVNRGVWSLVFKCYDEIEEKYVALKFYDIDPNKLLDQYRISAFRREPELLQTLLGKGRCLQLAAGLKNYNLVSTYPDGTKAALPCMYFAVDWLADEIDHFFFDQVSFSPVEKLHLFHEVTMAVRALHDHSIHHRDVKPDNLRAHLEKSQRIVVAIDLGTAARSDSISLKSSYDHVLGAPAYSAPEAFCGLSGHRTVAPHTDMHALGCLLFQLFNRERFALELIRLNPHYDHILSILALELNKHPTIDEKLVAWHKHAGLLGSITRVGIDAPGNTLPPSIESLLDELVLALTHPIFSKRERSFERVAKRVWTAIRVLEHEETAKARTDQNRLRRAMRLQALLKKDLRLNTYLQPQPFQK